MTVQQLNRPSAIVAFLFGLLTLAVSSPGAVINVGTHVFTTNTGVQTFTLSVSGTENVAGEDFYAQIGDGGTFNGGTNAHPIFSNVDIITGTPFALNNVGAYGDESPGGNASHPLIWVDGTTTSSGTVQLQSNSVFATISIDTTAAKPGSYPLLISGVASSLGPFNTTFYDAGGNPIPLTVTNGSLTIVPEPSSVLFLGAMILLLFVGRPMPRRLRPAIACS